MEWWMLGVGLALLVFWAVGAYNRISRLRAEVLRQWDTVETIWLKWLLRFQAQVSARQILAWASESDDLQALQEACEGVVEALAKGRTQIFSAQGAQTLLQRHARLMQCIDEVAQRVPANVQSHLMAARTRMLQNIPPTLVPYHQAVENHAQALQQAPARWLAQGLGLRPAQRLRLSLPHAG